MTASNRVGWYTLIFLAVLGAALGVCGLAHGAAPTLRDRIALAAPGIASRKVPTVDALELANAVIAATPSREWAALLLTLATHESALSADIAVGVCRPLQCDGGKAWGLWQVHRTARNAAVWGSPSLVDQAREASHLARGAFYMCAKSGVPFPLSTIRGYAGRGCTQAIPGEAQRVATYQRLLRRL